MSEKRILIKEVSGNCRFLREVGFLSLAQLLALNEVGNYCSANGWKRIANNQCKSCNKAKYVGITREQFIMVVAKAICRTDGEDCETCGFNGNEKGCKQYLEIGNYITLAKAALEDVLEFGERPNIYKEDWDTLREYADSVHNIILALLSQKTDADTLKTVHDMREFLVFDPSKWKYNSDCIVLPEGSKENA